MRNAPSPKSVSATFRSWTGGRRPKPPSRRRPPPKGGLLHEHRNAMTKRLLRQDLMLEYLPQLKLFARCLHPRCAQVELDNVIARQHAPDPSGRPIRNDSAI